MTPAEDRVREYRQKRWQCERRFGDLLSTHADTGAAKMDRRSGTRVRKEMNRRQYRCARVWNCYAFFCGWAGRVKVIDWCCHQKRSSKVLDGVFDHECKCKIIRSARKSAPELAARHVFAPSGRRFG